MVLECHISVYRRAHVFDFLLFCARLMFFSEKNTNIAFIDVMLLNSKKDDVTPNIENKLLTWNKMFLHKRFVRGSSFLCRNCLYKKKTIELMMMKFGDYVLL